MAGWLLVLGSVTFMVGAANPMLFRVWTAPQETQLRLIHAVPKAWIITNLLMVLATVLTATGLWFVPGRVGQGGLPFAQAAAVVYLFAATAWLLSLVFRLAVTPDAASAFVAQGSLDPAYRTLDRWVGGLFGAFTYLAAASLVVLGVAVIQGGALGALAGWAAVAIGVIIAGGYAVSGDMPPFVSYVPTGLLGIILLLQPGA